MKKYLVAILFVSICCSYIFAQNNRGATIIDTVQIRCLYRQQFVMDTLEVKKKTVDLMLLDIGQKVAKYHSYHTYIADSLLTVMSSQNLSDSEKDSRKLKKVDYNNAKQRIMDNRGLYMAGSSLITGVLPPHNYVKKPYNPIERTE
jgi:GLPGLI family protein